MEKENEEIKNTLAYQQGVKDTRIDLKVKITQILRDRPTDRWFEREVLELLYKEV